MDPLKKLVFLFSILRSAFMGFPRAHTTMSACTSVSMSPLPQRGAFGLSRMQWHHQEQFKRQGTPCRDEKSTKLHVCVCVRTWVCVCVKCWQIGLWACLSHTGTSCSLYCREILGQEWGFHHKKVWISKVLPQIRSFEGEEDTLGHFPAPPP